MTINGKYIKTIYKDKFMNTALFTFKENETGHFFTCESTYIDLIYEDELVIDGYLDVKDVFVVSNIKKKDSKMTDYEYLTSGIFSGIGEVTASKLIESLEGLSLSEYIEKYNDLPKVKGLTPERAANVINSIKNSRALRQFITTCEGYGLSYSKSFNIYKKYGQGSDNILKKYPYKLAKDRILTVYEADSVANCNNIDPYLPERIQAFICQALENAKTYGNTYVCVSEIKRFIDYVADRSSDSCEIPMLLVYKEIQTLKKEKFVHTVKTNDDYKIYLQDMYIAETSAARNVKRLEKNLRNYDIDEDIIDEIEAENGFKYDGRQRNTFNCLKTNGIKIINGGPGTGKTTTVKGILSYIKRKNKSFVLAAPTGRASQRLAEVTGEMSSTVHKLLDLKPFDNKIGRSRKEPIKAEYILVDEVNMVGIELFSLLLEAIEDGSTLILVGDEDQLQSVQPGSVFADLIRFTKEIA